MVKSRVVPKLELNVCAKRSIDKLKQKSKEKLKRTFRLESVRSKGSMSYRESRAVVRSSHIAYRQRMNVTAYITRLGVTDFFSRVAHGN